MMANVTCNEVGEAGCCSSSWTSTSSTICPSSRRRDHRAKPSARCASGSRPFPTGVYRNRIQIEGVDEPLTLACAVNIAGDGVHVDFDGTAPSIRRGINVPLCYTRALTNYAIKCLTIPEIPNNEGAANPISSPRRRAASSMPCPRRRQAAGISIGHFVAPLIFGALADALPDRVQADSGMLTQFNCQGTNRDGRGVSSIFFASGGFGALKGIDGAAGDAGPLEHDRHADRDLGERDRHERAAKALLPNTAAPASFAAGTAQEIGSRNDSGHPLNAASFAGPDRVRAARRSGRWRRGACARRDQRQAVHPKGRYMLQPGDVFETLEAGGGGFGDPRMRPPEQLLADVRDGYVTVEGARRDYGVEVDIKRGTARRVG